MKNEITDVEEFINKANTADVREFLNFCAETRVFPSDTSLKAYRLRCEWADVNVKVAKWIIDNKALSQLTQLMGYVRDLVNDINEDDERSYTSADKLHKFMYRLIMENVDEKSNKVS